MSILVVPEAAAQTARIIECRSRASTTPGQTAEIAFLDVEWDQIGPELPTRLIAKYTSQNPQVIAEIVMFSISIVVRRGSIEILRRLASMWRLVSFNAISRISRRLCSSLKI